VVLFSRPVTGPPPELPGYVVTEPSSGIARP
jgi:hypothetical protein